MDSKTIESVRWMDLPSRVVVLNGSQTPKAWLQATAPMDVSAMCKGRQVEELPRILTILSPAHHLASAMALDKLFGVEPPALAVNMREALLQAQFLTSHLRKLYFLLTAFENPFEDFTSPRKKGPSHESYKKMDDIMKQLALAQEACAILGGRYDHPLTALPGGVSRFLKEELYERLGEIAEALLDGTQKTAAFFIETIFSNPKAFEKYAEVGIDPMAGMAVQGRDVSDPENLKEGEIVLTDRAGKQAERFAADKAKDKIDLATEPWTHVPFAYLKDKGWKGAESGADGLYFVGPLARLNSGVELATPKAEEQRQNMIKDLEAFPHFTVKAAFRALVVESVGAAEQLAELCVMEKLIGASIRDIPKEIGREGLAALETPQGLVYHRYQCNEKGIVEDVRVVDVSAENNGLRCQMAQKAYENAAARKDNWDNTKKQIEISLLPF